MGMIRGIIRDVIGIYIGFKLLMHAYEGIPPSSEQMMLYALGLLIFSVWFMLERIGLLPKII